MKRSETQEKSKDTQTKAPETKSINDRVDIFESAVKEHQKNLMESDNPFVNEDMKETFTKMNQKTIDNFGSSTSSWRTQNKLNFPEHNTTIQGRYTNGITNIAFTNELASDFKKNLRDLQQTVKKVKRNADMTEPYISLKLRIDTFRQGIHKEFIKNSRALVLINNDILRFKSENDHIASVLLDCEKRMGRLEKHVGIETPSKIESLGSNPQIDHKYYCNS